MDQPETLHARKRNWGVNAWGMSSICAFALSFASMALCEKLFRDNPNIGLFPYALFDLLALGFGIAAAVRGSRWWLLASLLAMAFATQAFLAMATS